MRHSDALEVLLFQLESEGTRGATAQLRAG